MTLLLASCVQAALCVVSFYYLAILGPWAESLPWRLVFPIGFGLMWLMVTAGIIRRGGAKPLFILLALVELPFAFGWPAWMFLYILSGH
jgi:hypothetical protein